MCDGLPRLLRQQRRHAFERGFDGIQHVMGVQDIQQLAIKERTVATAEQPPKAFRQTRQTFQHELCTAIGAIAIPTTKPIVQALPCLSHKTQ